MQGFRAGAWRWGVFFAGLWLAAAGALAAKPTVHGKTLLHTYSVPAEALERFMRFNAKAKPTGSIAPDTEDWAGEQFHAATNGNPYTIVVRASGMAEAAGDVTARWSPGWNLEGTVRSSFTPQVRKEGAKAGERVELVSASAPVRFKEDRPVLPVVGFAGSMNLKLDAVTVEVWSGVGKPSWLQLLSAWAPLLTGMVFLGLFLWWRRR